MNVHFQGVNQRCFGTYPLRGHTLMDALSQAIEVGYRAIDTAQMYENELEVGTFVSRLGELRDELCITTKVHPDNYAPERFLSSVGESLEKLQLQSVDVLLLHWPPIGGNIKEPLELLAEAFRLGYAKNVGVSNFTAQMMYEAKAQLDISICTNQVEFHPLLNQDKLNEASVNTEIPLSSYCPLARGELFKYPIFADIAKNYDKTPAQIVLRWILQKGVSLNMVSTKPHNISSNFDIMDFTLSNIDMEKIDAMNSIGLRVVNEDLVPWAPNWD